MTTPQLGTCYYPEHWPEDRWALDAKMMREAGLSIIRIGEFAWSRMEPTDGHYDFDWLDRAFETLAAEGLKIVLGTPTATPPKWLVDKMPDMIAVDAFGHPRRFGSRRHYCFSHLGYRKECARITEILAKRYGNHPALIGWQTDNEYGCHDTVESYSDAALLGFRDWLAQKYQSPDALNKAWGNVFWSMELNNFVQAELPNLTVTEANPAHRLDFQRYSSDQVVAFNRLQCEIIRKYSPKRDIVHNFMGSFVTFDHFDVSQDLDVATWDSYPIGFLDRDANSAERRERYMRVGDPDLQAFHHDLYRACGRGRMWVMEQQPGPVNWAPHNPSPAKGAVRLWTWEAFAAGAELVSYFRWRQAPFAQEQMHEALLLPNAKPNEAYFVAQNIANEITQADITLEAKQARAALVFDYESAWAWMIQPQAASFTYLGLVLDFYRAMRRNGLTIDIIPAVAGAAQGYDLVICPGAFSPSDDFIASLDPDKQVLVFGPRTGAKTQDFAIPDNLPPGDAIGKLIDIKIWRIDSIPPSVRIGLQDGGTVTCWREFIHVSDDLIVLARTTDDEPVHVATPNNRVHYIAAWPDEVALEAMMTSVATMAGLETRQFHHDIRLRDQGDMRFIFNHGPQAVDVADLLDGRTPILGDTMLEACGVLIAK